MFFVSKKSYETAVEKEVNRRMAEHDRQVSFDMTLGEIHRMQRDMDCRLRVLEHPPQSGCCDNKTCHN